jgi:hypothetical protein
VFHDAGQSPIEEELGAGTSTPTARVLVIAVVLIAAVAVPLTIVVDRSRSGSVATHPTSAVSPARGLSAVRAADALVPGAATSNGLGHRLVYTAELDNATSAVLTVDYPIRVVHSPSWSTALRYVDVTATGGLVDFDAPSPRITQIPAHGKSTLQIGLRVECTSLPQRPIWPTDDSTIVIRLAGYPTPVVFTFAGLFGFNIDADVHNACRSPSRLGDR